MTYSVWGCVCVEVCGGLCKCEYVCMCMYMYMYMYVIHYVCVCTYIQAYRLIWVCIYGSVCMHTSFVCCYMYVLRFNKYVTIKKK